MRLNAEFIAAIALNIFGIGTAYGLIRGRLNALEKAERELKEALRESERKVQAEIVITRERVHDLADRMAELVLEIVKLRGSK